MRYCRRILLAINILLLSMGSAGARLLTEKQECAIHQAEVAAGFTQCLDQARIEGMRKGLSDEAVERRAGECEAMMLEQAAALALASKRPCDVASEALASRDWNPDAEGKGRRAPKKPQIPTVNFEWNGTFVGNAADFNDPPEVAALTVRGKWKGKHFNVYMRQGDRHSKTWVENVLFEDKLYTITHKWHTDTAKIRPILGVCIRNTIYNPADPSIPLPINVKGLNLLLNSSRFVGLEKIGGKPMNHFRTTCLATAGLPGFPFLQPFKVFSDIYVPPGRSHPWTKWLQYGDGVGPDSQEDEWFLFDEWNDDPADIKLPWQCRDPKKTFEVQQTSCTNLIPESTEQ